eukprot:3291226-Rhodomonas_salina.2
MEAVTLFMEAFTLFMEAALRFSEAITAVCSGGAAVCCAAIYKARLPRAQIARACLEPTRAVRDAMPPFMDSALSSMDAMLPFMEAMLLFTEAALTCWGGNTGVHAPAPYRAGRPYAISLGREIKREIKCGKSRAWYKVYGGCGYCI